MSWPLVKYVLTAALRDKLILSLVVSLLLATSLATFLGSAAITEQDQFALVFAGGGLRFVGVLGLVLFVVFLIRRSFEAKDVEFLLSRPISRVGFLLSYAAAFSFLAFVMGLAQGVCIFILAPYFFDTGNLLWVISLMVENIIMVNVALFFAMILSSAASAAMTSLGFYILARMMGQVLGIIDSGSKIYDLQILEVIMQAISAVMPRLDLMGQTSWLIYGADGSFGFSFVILQGVIFTVLVLLATLIDLIRRQF